MEVQLAVVNGTEVPVEDLRFSFENTPAREGWFQTYTRQDQGDEILYYPEPKSFPLPYEMPISTFYPRKDKGEIDSRKGKHLWSQSRSSSKDTSVNPSGSVTPNNTNLGTFKEIDNETSKKKGKPNSFATALAASNRLKEALTSVRKTRGGKSEHSALASSQFNHLERKSPRCHASTKSLISATFGGLGNDNTMDNQRSGAVVDAYSTRMDGLLAKDSMTDKEQASKNLDLRGKPASSLVVLLTSIDGFIFCKKIIQVYCL